MSSACCNSSSRKRAASVATPSLSRQFRFQPQLRNAVVRALDQIAVGVRCLLRGSFSFLRCFLSARQAVQFDERPRPRHRTVVRKYCAAALDGAVGVLHPSVSALARISRRQCDGGITIELLCPIGSAFNRRYEFLKDLQVGLKLGRGARLNKVSKLLMGLPRQVYRGVTLVDTLRQIAERRLELGNLPSVFSIWEIRDTMSVMVMLTSPSFSRRSSHWALAPILSASDNSLSPATPRSRSSLYAFTAEVRHPT